jgi:uncharacterized protein (DUF983 family)
MKAETACHPLLVGVIMIIGWLAIGITAVFSLWFVLATASIMAAILNIVDLHSTAIIYVLAIYIIIQRPRGKHFQ